MQACLVVSKGLDLFRFMLVLGFGRFVCLPRYGGIKQMVSGQTCYT